ncbi:S-layer homology domain-containing protein [Symbiobacterium terraclitae]|nr:S-layer homology domain-containing protein [Symbiobacterium terraclitae]
MRRLFSLLLALALLLGSVAPTLAANGGWRSWFLDVPEDDWALPYVVEMQTKGLMKGVGNGLFQPQAPLTRAQAVTVAIRLMGLEDEVYDLDEDEIASLLPFSDRRDIPDWARPYIAVAVDHDIVPVAEDGLLRADENATRLWVSVLLVRALGYEAEAQAKMKANLPFRDADLIPASLVGYVAAAVDHELVAGFPDGTFRPNDALTRAQAAALLSRTDRQLGELGRFRPGILTGDLVRVSARDLTITLNVQGRNRTLQVFADAPVFLDERPADLGGLPQGARVSVVLDSSERVLLIMARTPVKSPNTSGVSGEISAIFLPSEMAGGLGLLVLETSGGRERTYPLAPQVTATYNGRKIDLGELRVGDKVTVDVVAGVAIAIDVTQRSSGTGSETQIKGTVTAVHPYSISFLGSIDLKVGNTTRTVTVAPGVVITKEGNRVDLTDLEKGDEVTVRLAGGVAIRITVDKPARREETVRGEIQTLYPATKNSEARIRLKTDSGSTRTVTLAKNAVIRYGNNRLNFADLRAGDEVQVRLVNGAAEEVRVLSRGPVIEEVKGTIQDIVPATRTTGPKVTVKTSKGNKTVTLATDVTIKQGSKRLKLDELRLGDEVTIKVVDGIGTEMTIHSRGPLVEEVSGIIEAIAPAAGKNGPKLTVKTSKGSKTVTLATDVTIKHGSKRLKADELRLGDEVTIKVVDGVGTEVTVTTRGPQVEEVKGTVEAVEPATRTAKARVTVKTADGSRRITLADDVSIRHGNTRLKVGDLRPGDKVVVKVVGGTGTEIRVEERGPVVEEVKGTISEIFPVSITFQSSIEVDTGKEKRTIALAPDVAISYGRQRLTLDDLRKGDQVTVTVTAGVATAIQVHERGPESETLQGTIEEIYPVSITFQSSIDLRTDDGVRHITLAPDVVITRAGKPVQLDDLRKGDRVTVTLVAGVATAIEAEQVSRNEVTGQVLAVYHMSITFQPSILVKVEDGTRLITVGPETLYRQGNRTLELADLLPGDRVRVGLVAGIAATVDVVERPRTSVVKGTIVGVADRDITVRVGNGRERVLTLADNVLPFIGESSVPLDEVYTGDRVELEVRGDVIIKMSVERRSRDVRND